MASSPKFFISFPLGGHNYGYTSDFGKVYPILYTYLCSEMESLQFDLSQIHVTVLYSGVRHVPSTRDEHQRGSHFTMQKGNAKEFGVWKINI